MALQPVTDVRDCQNYAGSGNASAFPDESWDLLYPVVLYTWLLAVITEQFLPPTWNGRRTTQVLTRSLLATTIALTTSCCTAAKLLSLCH